MEKKVKPPKRIDKYYVDYFDKWYCYQCRDCIHWGNGIFYSRDYFKMCCDKYPYPGRKPKMVFENNGKCRWKEPREDTKK